MPRLEGLVIDDAFAERLFAALGVDKATVAEPNGRRRALGRLTLAALEDMLARAEGQPAVDRERLATELAVVAGGARAPEPVGDAWGVPTRFWTPDRDWHEPAEADRWTWDLERTASALVDLRARRTARTVVLTDRLLPTGDERTSGLVLAPAGEVAVVVRVGPEAIRLRFAPGTAVAGGILASDPEPITERR